jgi:addiction module HigA family antidote
MSDLPKNGLPKIHPGEILREEYCIPVIALADGLGVSCDFAFALIDERQSITPDLAYRLAKFLGTTHEFWLNLQTAYEASE